MHMLLHAGVSCIGTGPRPPTSQALWSVTLHALLAKHAGVESSSSFNANGLVSDQSCARHVPGMYNSNMLHIHCIVLCLPECQEPFLHYAHRPQEFPQHGCNPTTQTQQQNSASKAISAGHCNNCHVGMRTFLCGASPEKCELHPQVGVAVGLLMRTYVVPPVAVSHQLAARSEVLAA